MIGFFGGSFDPVHYGHLKMASAVKEELGLSQLFLMPCKTPVHKKELQFSNQQRLEMLNLAVLEFNDLQVDTREMNRQSASYTIDTLKEIKADYPNESIFLLIGADSFKALNTWKNYRQFSDYAQLVVLPRVTNERQKMDVNVIFSNTPLVNISSTQIRGILKGDLKGKINENLNGLVPKKLINYLRDL
ncbi:Nicotinate-nucleotide adenylyltransferase [hydrothermal vent metagenome]|uniref:Nicotinate-nucleotide adenylyltransferase n=1 Tax=hydrothermal vent metagenome TaxID=652676 RepID=A0A1W1DU46_9ZZZZ